MGVKVIYCIENKINGHRYVGSAKDWYGRKRTHLSQLRRNIHYNIVLQRAWEKYGEQNFSFIILENIENETDLIIREQWWIDNSNSEYNICKIAGNSLGIKRRPESIEKMRQVHLGEKHPEWRNQIKSLAQGGENHWTKKKKFSEEAKKKMSETHKRLYAEGYIHPNKGKQFSAERIAKMKTSGCIKIYQFQKDGSFIKEWPSIKSAALSLNIFPGSISYCAKNKTKSAGGFIWKYEN